MSSVLCKQEMLDETWRALELMLEQEYVRSIGVSNWSVQDLERLMDNCSVVPHINQVEFHPYQNPRELREFCDENKIQLEGFAPLGKGRLLNEDAVLKVAKMENRSP